MSGTLRSAGHPYFEPKDCVESQRSQRKRHAWHRGSTLSDAKLLSRTSLRFTEPFVSQPSASSSAIAFGAQSTEPCTDFSMSLDLRFSSCLNLTNRRNMKKLIVHIICMYYIVYYITR